MVAALNEISGASMPAGLPLRALGAAVPSDDAFGILLGAAPALAAPLMAPLAPAALLHPDRADLVAVVAAAPTLAVTAPGAAVAQAALGTVVAEVAPRLGAGESDPARRGALPDPATTLTPAALSMPSPPPLPIGDAAPHLAASAGRAEPLAAPSPIEPVRSDSALPTKRRTTRSATPPPTPLCSAVDDEMGVAPALASLASGFLRLAEPGKGVVVPAPIPRSGVAPDAPPALAATPAPVESRMWPAPSATAPATASATAPTVLGVGPDADAAREPASLPGAPARGKQRSVVPDVPRSRAIADAPQPIPLALALGSVTSDGIVPPMADPATSPDRAAGVVRASSLVLAADARQSPTAIADDRPAAPDAPAMRGTAGAGIDVPAAIPTSDALASPDAVTARASVRTAAPSGGDSAGAEAPRAATASAERAPLALTRAAGQGVSDPALAPSVIQRPLGGMPKPVSRKAGAPSEPERPERAASMSDAALPQLAVQPSSPLPPPPLPSPDGQIPDRASDSRRALGSADRAAAASLVAAGTPELTDPGTSPAAIPSPSPSDSAPAATGDFRALFAAAPSASLAPRPKPPVTLPFDRAAVPVARGDQLGLEIVRHISAGKDALSVALTPEALGRVEVQMRFDDSGTLRAVVSASTPEALNLLHRDSALLDQALTSAGVQTDAHSFRFDSQAGSGGAQRQPEAPVPTEPSAALALAEPDEADALQPLRSCGVINLLA